jgi:hypothetical protein
MRKPGTGSISRKVLSTGRIRYEASAPAPRGQKSGESLGTFDTPREAEEAIAAWMRERGVQANG